MIHGLGVDHRILLPLEKQLAGQPWKRIYIDLPWAEGATDTGAASPREMAHEVLAEVREIVGDGPFAVLGYSFGAMVARFVAHELRGQCVGLATLAGLFVPDRDSRIVPEHEVIKGDIALLERVGELREDFESLSVIQTVETFEAFKAYVDPGVHGANHQVLERISATYNDAPDAELEAPDRFTAPSLHVFGRQDRVVGYEDGFARRAHYPRGSFVVIDGAGHNAHLEQPEIVGAHMRSWLQLAAQA